MPEDGCEKATMVKSFRRRLLEVVKNDSSPIDVKLGHYTISGPKKSLRYIRIRSTLGNDTPR